nr:antiviral reverse transcriptase Drt3a [Pseudomonas mendocina]
MMLDQMFSAENFRHIYDIENRKGVDLATRYFPALKPLTLAIREKVQSIRDLRKIEATFKAEDFQERLRNLKDELAILKEQKSSAIDTLMSEISQRVLKPCFKICLSQKTGPKGKPVFCIDTEPETFFVIKQLQRNIHFIYGVKQANRHDLACQLRDILRSKFPFEIVRTDISSFYESIDRKRLLEKIDRDQLLSPASKKYIKQVLDSYGDISGATTGIPRGVGISAYLAELYLKPVDTSIIKLPGLVLYCRFVDDIVAVFARPPAGKALGSFKDQITSIFGENGLTHNTAKTSELNLANTNPKKFEYLGYRFLVESGGKVDISPSAAKVAKYRTRINSAFAEYWREKSISSRSAYRKLVGRVKFLTGNTRLSNSKSCAATGIYFNNPIATNLTSFALLDKQLSRRIDELKRTSLQKQLKKLKFTTGFEQRRFHNFSTKELQVIVRTWKNV